MRTASGEAFHIRAHTDPHDLPPTPKGAHIHQCTCTTYLVCFSEPDHCGVQEPFNCPTCEQVQRDEHMSRIAKETAPPQRPRHRHKYPLRPPTMRHK